MKYFSDTEKIVVRNCLSLMKRSLKPIRAIFIPFLSVSYLEDGSDFLRVQNKNKSNFVLLSLFRFNIPQKMQLFSNLNKIRKLR